MSHKTPPSPDELLAGHTKVADGATARADVMFCFAVLLAEGLLVLLALAGKLPLIWLLVLHAGVVGALAVVLDWRERRKADARLITIALVTVAITGPLGALLTAILGLALMAISVDGAILRRWYDRIVGEKSDDDADLLYEQIVSGRTLNPHVDAGARFAAIMRNGPLEEKQRILGLIAQKYHPEFLGLLKAAMRSPDPPLRVQAAAVAARLQGDERARLKAISAACEGAMTEAGAASELCLRLERQIDSGLLDEQDRSHALRLALELARAARAKEPQSAEAATMLGRVLGLADLHEEAAGVLAAAIALGSEAARPMHRESLMRLRRFADLPPPATTGQAA